MPTFRFLGNAVSGSKSLNDDKIAEFMRANTFNTIMGHVKFGADGEWATSRMLQVQYHGLTKEFGSRNLSRHGDANRADA